MRLSSFLSAIKSISLVLILSFLLYACGDKKTTQQTESPSLDDSSKAADSSSSASSSDKISLKPHPTFDADYAYDMVVKQVVFGPRVPNTKPHKQCGDFLIGELKKHGWQVMSQEFEQLNYKGGYYNLRNIIGMYRPEAKRRLILAAHWDTRHIADMDPVRPKEPIDGANDGGSGVGVLLSIAKTLSEDGKLPADLGIDIVFFDGEDQGEPDGVQPVGDRIWWCLGSQYWAAKPHKPNYKAEWGILLDMVGNKDAKFAKEGGSVIHAPQETAKVWKVAKALGYTRFQDKVVEQITDDHEFVNTIAKIKMLDIIEYDNSDGIYFSSTWHTHRDNLANIDKETLREVGQTVLATLYQE